MKRLRLILGDQLNLNHSWYSSKDKDTIYCLFEMKQETNYVTHHITKIAAFFASMRCFADTLSKAGHQVIYYQIDDSNNLHTLENNIDSIISSHQIEKFEYQYPDEYRLDKQLEMYCKNLTIAHSSCDTEHFFTSRFELRDFFEGKNQLLMETFYRHMRKKHQVLLEDNKPIGGQWNFDKDNRKKWTGSPKVPDDFPIKNDISSIINSIHKQGIKYIGTNIDNHILFPINREQSLEVLHYFFNYLLPNFGTYEDAMHSSESFLFHSRLSFSLNTKMLHPSEVISAAIDTWTNNPDKINIAQLEGFVRQILGWREYMRGIYWAKMPEYKTLNFFNNTNTLPTFFWDGNTQLNCLSICLKNSLDNAYAHHIQRLMVIGNFCLLAGIHPDEVDQWYLGIYIDAIEWVEITNTRGMSQYADGGIVASKPYICGSNYIDKMSNYCKDCKYDKSIKVGENACPFNSLYWNFIDKNQDILANNNRMSMMFNLWNKNSDLHKQEIILQAEKYLNNLHLL
jgi:deoxyribodipyrimidine photolyase-related protein